MTKSQLKGSAIVEFESLKDAEFAVNKLNKSEIEDDRSLLSLFQDKEEVTKGMR